MPDLQSICSLSNLGFLCLKKAVRVHLKLNSSLFHAPIFPPYREWTVYHQDCSYYHVMALFLMLPMSLKQKSDKSTQFLLNECIDLFFKAYVGKFLEGEQQKFKKTLEVLLLDPVLGSKQELPYVGLWSEYLQFKQKRTAFLTQYTAKSHHKPGPNPKPQDKSTRPDQHRKNYQH